MECGSDIESTLLFKLIRRTFDNEGLERFDFVILAYGKARKQSAGLKYCGEAGWAKYN